MTSDDPMRGCFALMAHYALLSDPAACTRLILNKRLASGLLTAVAARGCRDSNWVRMQQDGPEPPDHQLPACLNGDATALSCGTS
jgi:hypothetical protein